VHSARVVLDPFLLVISIESQCCAYGTDSLRHLVSSSRAFWSSCFLFRLAEARGRVKMSGAHRLDVADEWLEPDVDTSSFT
jgi:hypothetical protein